MSMDYAGFSAEVGRQQWIFAKTMPKTPHWYCLRKNFADDSVFVAMCNFIREQGKEEAFDGRMYTYLYHDGYKYWTMGSPIDILSSFVN